MAAKVLPLLLSQSIQKQTEAKPFLAISLQRGSHFKSQAGL